MTDHTTGPRVTTQTAHRRPLLQTLYGKLAAILFGLFLLIGLLYTAWMIRTSQLYLQAVNQKLNINLARRLATERILFSDGRINPRRSPAVPASPAPSRPCRRRGP